MNRDTALAFVEELLFTHHKKSLSFVQREVFYAAWDNESYEKCAERLNYQADTLRATGAWLWKLLGKTWNCQVTKKSLKSVVSHQWRLLKEQQKQIEKEESSVISIAVESPILTEEKSLVDSDNQKQDIFFDPNFVGRKNAITELDRLRKRGSKLVQIVAPGGQGKTTLAKKYLHQNFSQVLEIDIAQDKENVASVESILEEKLQQIGEEPGREFMVSLDRFKRKLQSMKIGILVDNLEPALRLDETGLFLPEHRRYIELLRVLSDFNTQSFTLITSRERLSESLDTTLYSLPSLTIEAWEKFWYSRKVYTDSSLLADIHKVYGGNALAMKVLVNSIVNDFHYDTLAYWQYNRSNNFLVVETAVANLIKQQFNRLKKQVNTLMIYSVVLAVIAIRIFPRFQK